MSRVPRIRFKGFEEDWEQRKLISCLSLLKDGTHGTHKDYPSGPLLLSAKNIKNGRVNYDETDRRISYKDFEKIHSNFKLQVGDVLLTIVGSIGETALLQNTFGLTFQRSVAFLRVTDNIIPEFLMSEINTSRFKNELENRKSTSAQPGIYLGDLGEIPVFISKNSDEQLKIGSYFDSLNHLITLHQRKLEKLKIIKKSMFENLFPQNGEKTPKIRFSGFNEDWEQRKFGELFLEKRDKTEIEDEDILLSCAITGIYLNSELFSHFRGTSNIGYLKIKKNDLILSAQNLHLGNANVNLLFEHGIISPAYKVYELNKCDQYFVQSWVKKDSTKDFFLNATTEGASQCRKNIDWCILNNQLIAIPSLYEQIRIGKLFHCLNYLITLHQSKLDKLQKIKKSMLESMFV